VSKSMKTTILVIVNVVWLGAAFSSHAQSTSFTYQGRLTDGANSANGIYGLRFALYDAPTGGTAVAGPLTNGPVTVSNGPFTVLIDFGSAPFTGANRWLEIGVRTNGSADPFMVVSPRQLLTPSPYALYALGSGAVAWSNVSGLPPGFADGVDNDTIYSAGIGLDLTGTQFSVRFGGTGSSGAAARADHNHDATYALLNGNQTFGGTNTFSGVVVATNEMNLLAGTFSGNGFKLTDLNAGSLSTGTVPEARIDSLIARDSEVFSIVLARDGAGSGLDADLLDGRDSSFLLPPFTITMRRIGSLPETAARARASTSWARLIASHWKLK
jgi:hypothetical protein